MSPEERDPAYLWDMLDRSRHVTNLVLDLSFESYVDDAKSRAAVERELTVLGEAARRVSASFKAQHPEIPWSDLVGLRNVLTHDYGKLEQEQIWKIATRDVPELVRQLEVLISPGSD